MTCRQIQIQIVGTELCVTANLLEELNPEACETLWSNLPYLSIQLHTVVAGKNIFNFIPDHTPFFRDIPKVARRMECNPGTIFSPFPRSMFIKYGEDSEDQRFPPVAQVVESDLETLEQIGRLCWQGMYQTKHPQKVAVTRLGQPTHQCVKQMLKLIEPNIFKDDQLQRLVADINQATEEIWLHPPAELEKLVTGNHSFQTKMGSFGQYFSTTFFACQELSRVATFINHGTFDNLLRLSLRHDMKLKQLKVLISSFCDTSTNFLKMCGQNTFCNFYERIDIVFQQLRSKKEFFNLFSAFTLYADQYYAWAIFLFPWELGNQRLYHRNEVETLGVSDCGATAQAPPKQFCEFGEALEKWRQALGQENVCTNEADLMLQTFNTSEFEARTILAHLSPANVEEIKKIIQIAAQHAVPLYPFSTGKNWGLGSRLPVQGTAVLVDLSRLNRILEVNEEFGYAVIEPGVTQGQLSEYLSKTGSRCKLNVTGSGRMTSIVGNILDRGAGCLGPRSQDLLEIEIVLGNGNVVRTGLWHFIDNHQTDLTQHYYPPGLGADLTGLFVQSNLGIVTRMAVRLHPMNQMMEVGIEVSESILTEFIDEIRQLLDEGILQGNVRYTNGHDPFLEIFPENRPATFMAHATVIGSQSMRIAGRDEVERRLAPFANCLEFFDSELDTVESRDGQSRDYLETRLDLLYGIPSNQRLEKMANYCGKTIAQLNGTIDQDRNLYGFLCTNVAIPFSGKHVVQAINIVRETASLYSFPPSIFFATLDHRALSGFFPFYFDRNNLEEIERVHKLKSELHRKFSAIGIYPMRGDIDSIKVMNQLASDTFWATIRTIKSALDPSSIIAPGRYCPQE